MNNKIKLPEYTLYNGEKIPCIGLGTFGSDKCSAEEIANAVKGAIDAGYTMFDCAACYGNEAEIGQVFKEAFDKNIVKREDLYIMTKVWNDMHRDVEASCRKSIEDVSVWLWRLPEISRSGGTA